MTEKEKIMAEALCQITDWYRGATEAPGGCSAHDAIRAIGDILRPIIGIIDYKG